MISLDEIEYLCKLAIYTPFVNKEKPVSIMLLAPSEHGKSELLKKFAFTESVHIGTDFNTFTFSEFAVQYPKKRTIIIPDFIRVTKKKYSTQSNSLTILNSITEEGWIGKLPLGQIIDKPIVANVLTALTKDELYDKRHRWSKIGFLSRFLPVSYSYMEKTKEQIRNYIKDRIYRNEKKSVINIPEHQIDVILPKKIANKIEKIVIDISKKENVLGFRLQRQLQTLCMANAISNNQNLVTDEDFKIIERLSKYINYKFVRI